MTETAGRRTPAPTVLVVRHEETCGPGHVGRWLAETGARLVEVRPYAGEAVPARVAADGLLVCGGAMGAYDDEEVPWLPATRSLLAAAVADGVPTWGLCLGGQMLAAACGGTVTRGRHGPEIGVRPFALTAAAAGDPLFGVLADRSPQALQWHVDEIVAPPPGAVLLATGDPYRHQAFRIGERAWGVQFHPEATVEEVAWWGDADGALLAAAGRTHREILGELAGATPALEALWRPVTERFAALLRQGPRAAGSRDAGRAALSDTPAAKARP